jgi:hypothetical protein
MEGDRLALVLECGGLEIPSHGRSWQMEVIVILW